MEERRVVVVCEGQTEQEFCRRVLAPYLRAHGLRLDAPLIARSGGGIVKWDILRQDIEHHLASPDAPIVTTMIDYYGLTDKHHFPGWHRSLTIVDRAERMRYLERGMKREVLGMPRVRFVPYIQLHEFEALLFCDEAVFYRLFTPDELVGVSELREVFDHYPNPELINNEKPTSPSHRLRRIIRGYNKIIHGINLAQGIGLSQMMVVAPRFRRWVTRLIELGTLGR